jgi:hypothetical protein
MHGTPSHKRSHLKLEMFEQVRATYYEEVFREEKEEREGGEALPARSSATREVRMAGSATDRNVVRGSRKLKKNAPKR